MNDPKQFVNGSNETMRGMHRRDVIKGTAAAGLALTVGMEGAFAAQSPSTDSGQAADNPVRKENAKPGTRDWLLTKVDITMNEPMELWRSPRIEGYCSATSVSAGDTLKIMVSTKPVSEFSLEIYRTGYYGGAGGRFMKRFDSLKGKTQPVPPVGKRRLRECRWEPSVEIEIPKDWLSGVYLGKLAAKKGGVQSYVIFIVRDKRPCELLFQCSDMTWLAYNPWPTNEYSLYHNDANGHTGYRKRKKWSTNADDTGWVSFDRPYSQFCQDHLVDRPSSVGSGEFLLWEFPLSYWMERRGYDVSYISNVDTHRDAAGLQRAKGFISVGHDEYWTREMYDNVSAARDAGVNLAFLSGNSICWEAPLMPSDAGQPNRIFRRGGLCVGEKVYGKLSEEMKRRVINLVGSFPPGQDAALLMGGRHQGLGGGDWVCTEPDHWLYDGAGMKAGDAVKGLVG
ncbi:MAG: N,N-dimethylformamidase beta subunit family domain-containing protein [Limisphaerales bacterium]